MSAHGGVLVDAPLRVERGHHRGEDRAEVGHPGHYRRASVKRRGTRGVPTRPCSHSEIDDQLARLPPAHEHEVPVDEVAHVDGAARAGGALGRLVAPAPGFPGATDPPGDLGSRIERAGARADALAEALDRMVGDGDEQELQQVLEPDEPATRSARRRCAPRAARPA